MKLIKCDRCGKEIEQKKWIDMPMAKIGVVESTIDGLKELDLCDDCKRDFWNWLERKDEKWTK